VEPGESRSLVYRIFERLSSRVSLSLDTFTTLVVWHLPKAWRSPRTNKLLALAEKQLARVERSFDVRSIADQHDDLILLLRLIFDSKQLTLFNRQRSRLVS
jgi:hypothetical protein